MVHLTPEQHAEVEHAAEPVNVIDPANGKEYVLITKEAYGRLYEVCADELSDEERDQLLRESGKSIGWDDPAMDVYDDLDPRRRQ